ncbi:hypothetical protein [Rickettsiella massiliensis]|uniref:hypothetical protein n=1 Tax=Rickettsiella massiliensis TaxID=676517 RepID=UPI00029AC01A|nr:hypothetical protein [Rickettsiella massiliensis]
MKENNNDKGSYLTIDKNNFDVINNTSQYFVLNEEDSKNIGHSLQKESSVILVGTFIAKKCGEEKLSVSFSYKEGDSIDLFTKTEVVQVQLNLEMIKSIPEKVAAKSKHEVEFLIINKYGLDATDINIIPGVLEDITIIEESINEKFEVVEKINDFSLEEFNLKQKNEKVLDSYRQFRVKGKVIINDSGLFKLGTWINYDEAQYLEKNEYKKGVEIVGSQNGKEIIVESISIIGELIEPLPDKIKLGKEYSIKFMFKNQSPNFSATDIKIDIKDQINHDSIDFSSL